MNLPKLRGNPKASKGQNFIRSRAFNYKQMFSISSQREAVENEEPAELMLSMRNARHERFKQVALADRKGTMEFQEYMSNLEIELEGSSQTTMLIITPTMCMSG